MKRKRVETKRHKLNNQGLTLVELLIAISILAVIVVPLLHAFISSMQVNAKARNSLRGTTIAQDITEGIKAYDVDELTYQFNFPERDFRVIDLVTVSGASVKEVRTTGSVSGATIPYTGVDATLDVTQAGHAGVQSTDGGVEHEFIGQEDGKYYFVMEGIPFHNKKYDAFIQLDATPYRAGGTSTIQPNDADVISISRMNTNFDAFYVQEPTQESEILSEFNMPGHVVDKSAIDRTITITVTKKSRAGKADLTEVSCNYAYKAVDPVVTGGIRTLYREHIIFNNADTSTDLQNIYLFYYPLYDWKSDTVVIKNEENIPLNFYVVKQYNSTGTATMLLDEMNYRMNLDIVEDGGSASSAKTRILTNLDTNLSDKSSVNQARLTFNGIATTFADLDSGDLTNSEKRDRFYDMVVSVYNEGAAANSFPQEDKLMTISGSKED